MNSLHLGEIVTSGDADLSSITGTHATFTDDWNDDAGGLGESVSGTAAPIIYGRSVETEELIKPFHKLLQSNQSQTVFLHGESGSGKTALVDTLREPVCKSQGYFVTGKYVQNSVVQEPYSAIMAAFSDLCDLTAQSDDFDDQRRSEIKKQLGPDAQLLVKAVTNLTPFISSNNPKDHATFADDENVETETPSFTRFKAACSSFLRTMASKEHPVVIFLDDIQWADGGSRLLMEMFMTDSDLKHVMFIMAYRDDESAQVADILQQARDPVNIALANLDSFAVHQMVCSILGSSTPDDLRDLSNLVAKRTSGQPFHVIMFMDFAVQERLLMFDEATEAWIFDIDTVQEEVMVSDTLADLLTRKIERLSYAIKETLKVASLLGYHFSGSLLANVACTAAMKEHEPNDWMSTSEGSQTSHTSVLTSLGDAVKAGFIEATREGYHFTHDKLQASFQSLLDEREEERLHILIGEAYLSQEKDEAAAYNAAVHLNCASMFLHNSQQRQKLAQINLKAAKYCEEKSAFVNAVTMLQHGLEALGPEGRWSKEYFDLTFEMMLCLAKNKIIIGDFEGCKQITREALTRCTTIEMKIKVILIDIDVRAALLEVDHGLLTAQEALRTLGVHMPQKVSARHVVMKLLKVKFMLRRKSDDYFRSLPATEDLVTTTAVKLLMYICSYGLLTDSQDVAVFSALLAMEITLKRGLSPLSPFAFAIYGVAEISLGNIDRAYRFGKIALSLLERTTSQEAACPTFGFTLTLLSCWKEPMRDLKDPLFEVGNAGFHRGDIVYGSYCLAQSYAMQVIRGANLERVEYAMRETYSLVSDMGQSVLLLWYQPYLQHTINMRSDAGNWENIGSLSGEIMNEEEFFQQAKEANNPLLVVIAMLYKAAEAAYFDQYQLAASIYDEADSLGGDALAISHGAPNYYWCVAQANFESFQITGQRRYLRKARTYLRMLQRMDANGCPNISPYLAFLDAESVSRRKAVSDTVLEAAYNKALAHLADSDLVHLEGLLSERAGFDFVKRGKRAQAEHYFQRANEVYVNEWGAIAKSIWLQERSEIALSGLYEHKAIESPLGGRCIMAYPNEQPI